MTTNEGRRKDKYLSRLLQLVEEKQPSICDVYEAEFILVSYFSRPANEITVCEIRKHRPYIPFYLAYLRMAFVDQGAVLCNLDRLLECARLNELKAYLAVAAELTKSVRGRTRS